MELRNYDETFKIAKYIHEEKALKDEKFIGCVINGSWVFTSESKVETFRGPKYSAWERVKSRMYSSRKKES